MKTLIAIWFLCAGLMLSQSNDSLIVVNMDLQERAMIVRLLNECLNYMDTFRETYAVHKEPAQRLREAADFLEKRDEFIYKIYFLIEYAKRIK